MRCAVACVALCKLVIQGRRTVGGTHRVSGNKNAALPMIAASLLTAEPVTIENVPDIADVEAMLNAMGVKISGAGSNHITVGGVERLAGCTARVGCDYIEAGSYLFAAAVTGGELTLTGIDPEVFEILEGSFRGKVHACDLIMPLT